eukprot:10317662-Ditylum_brightwellii.AAC.1
MSLHCVPQILPHNQHQAASSATIKNIQHLKMELGINHPSLPSDNSNSDDDSPTSESNNKNNDDLSSMQEYFSYDIEEDLRLLMKENPQSKKKINRLVAAGNSINSVHLFLEMEANA